MLDRVREALFNRLAPELAEAREEFERIAAPDPGLTAGTPLQGQFWSRDPASADGTGIALTDAIDLVICP